MVLATKKALPNGGYHVILRTDALLRDVCVARVAQLVEFIHGKDAVTGSNPGRGLIGFLRRSGGVCIFGFF